MQPTLEQAWRRTLEDAFARDRIAAASLAYQFLLNGSPFADLQTLVAARTSTLTGATTELIGPTGVEVLPKIPDGQVFIVDEYDVRVDDGSGGTALAAVLAGASLQFQIDNKRAIGWPSHLINSKEFALLGSVKKRKVIEPGRTFKVNLVEGAASGEAYRVIVSLVGRYEPAWLYRLAYLLERHPEAK